MARLLAPCAAFAAAFGFVEAAVVVYLRHIAYPDGFQFPLRTIDQRLMGVEIAREAATLVMLVSVARLAVTGGLRRFAVFAFCFGVWDIVYYAALRVCVGWPASLLDWDVLFLIPLPWTSPVLAPVLVSLTLIAASMTLLARPGTRVLPADWAVETAAGLLILLTFFWSLPAIEARAVPDAYPWWLFLSAWIGGILWFVLVVLRRPAVSSATELSEAA
jgi:hypothetical protein